MSKPSLTDLMNQIENWKIQTMKEIELHDRRELARGVASALLSK